MAQERALLTSAEGDDASALAMLRALIAQELPVHLEAATWNEIARREADLDAAIAAGRRALAAHTDSPEWAVGVCDLLIERLRTAGRLEDALVFLEERQRRQEQAWEATRRTELALLRVQLEVDRLRDESEALAAANARLAQAIREKDEFMAIASHDLRSPLTALQLAGSVLEESGHPLGARLRATTTRMNTMLSQLVSAHAAETAEAMPTAAIDGLALAITVVDQLAGRAAAKDVLVGIEGAGTLRAEPEALTRVLTNLVENAIKFGATRVDVVVAPGRVEVLDDGPGFTESDLARAFGKFARLSARPTADEPSTGLGLFIVRRLVEAMGGTVTAGNRDGGGAVFTITLPT